MTALKGKRESRASCGRSVNDRIEGEEGEPSFMSEMWY